MLKVVNKINNNKVTTVETNFAMKSSPVNKCGKIFNKNFIKIGTKSYLNNLTLL
jgi:hypothetical protein